MNTYYYILLLFLILPLFHLQGQTIDRSAITPAGDRYVQPATGELYWTIGETAIETFQNGPTLTLGFLQGNLSISGPVSVPDQFAGKVLIFPNPTSGSVHIHFEITSGYRVLLYDNPGRLILLEEINIPNHNIDLSALADGTYTLKIIDENNAEFTATIVKVTRQ